MKKNQNMKKYYYVVVTRTWKMVVKAEDEEQARRKANDYTAEEYDMDYDDEYQISEYIEEE